MTTEKIEDLRAELDAHDRQLIAILASRARITDRGVAVKKRDHLPAVPPGRLEHVVALVRGEAERTGLNPDLAESLWRVIFDWNVAYEKKALGEH